MCIHYRNRFALWTALLLLVVSVVACAPVMTGPDATTAFTPAGSAYPEPVSQDTAGSRPYPPPGEEPTPAWTPPPELIEPPTPTTPPLPTPIPAPEVTPIPVAEPPFIPQVIGKAQQPFWIYFWQENEIWRVNDQGQDRQLLLDTFKSLGLYLTANPHLETRIHTYQERRVQLAPDGKKLALVVVDKPELTYQGEPIAFSIYLFDPASGNLEFLSLGASPQWSPDSQHIAFHGSHAVDGFASDGGLWIADTETGRTYPLITGDPTNPQLYVSSWMWAPDGQRMAYRYSEGRVAKSEIWIADLADPSSPAVVPNVPKDLFLNSCLWMPDGQHLLCRVQNYDRPGQSADFWSISIQTGDQRLLFTGFNGGMGTWSPDGKWLALDAIRSYEWDNEWDRAFYNIWLVSADGAQLLRVTSAPLQELGVRWSPDGTRLLFQREGMGLVLLSLETGKVTSLNVNLVDLSTRNYAVGVGE